MMQNAASAMASAAQSILPSTATTTTPLKGSWTRLAGAPLLPRSSHSISIISGRAYLFGGEITPREPVDNEMHMLILPTTATATADYKTIPAASANGLDDVPERRVGHSAAVIGERIFMFGGRGGKDMKALEENGRVWIFDTKTKTWSHLDPLKGTAYPEARSYQCSAAIGRPRSNKQKPVKVFAEEPKPGVIAEQATTDAASGGYGTFFIHAGCLASGRATDLWGFDVAACTWRKYPDAPGPPRGGTSIAISKHRIYRYGGFDGKAELGGKLDVLELALETFDDKGGKGEMGVTAKGMWNTLDFSEEDMAHPGPRSVAGLQSITTGMGREYLLLLLGEGNPSDKGHDGAGKFLNDVWAFSAPPQGMTAASFTAAAYQAVGKETGEGLWSRVEVDEKDKPRPDGRGWFASAAMGDLDGRGVLVWGGLNEKNEREGDGWVFSLI